MTQKIMRLFFDALPNPIPRADFMDSSSLQVALEHLARANVKVSLYGSKQALVVAAKLLKDSQSFVELRDHFCDPLRGLQRRTVSNTVSNARELPLKMTNIGGQEVLQLGEIRTSESSGEEEIWA